MLWASGHSFAYEQATSSVADPIQQNFESGLSSGIGAALSFVAGAAPISLERACAALGKLWSPRVLGRVNDQSIKVVKVRGEFPWHSHEHEDEMFLVLRGCLRIGRSDADG